MARRWYVPLLALPVAIGTVVAVLVGVASASPGLTDRLQQGSAVHTVAGHPVNPGGPMISASGPGGATPNAGSNGVQQSPNWAGYAVSGRNGAFRSVSAAWVQPRANCRGVADQRLAAAWVGLDGFSDHMVEQTGADSDCNGSRPTYSGWYEMFPAPPVFFRNVLRPGDHMSASVTFRGTRTFILVLSDSTRHWVQRIIKNEARRHRSSAEFIEEAPSTQTGVLPLADFGTVRIARDLVNGRPLRRLPRTRIIMTEFLDGPLKANTSAVGSADAFTCRWIRST
jgi:hypothetical protein